MTYADGVTPVLPGDRVSVRFFLRRRSGEVIYVPGISARRGTYEHHGLTWVGVSLPDGWAIGTIVLPETRRLQRGVRFVGRGPESAEAADAVRRLDAQDADADQSDDGERAPAGPSETPRPVDWVAGGIAIVLRLGTYLLVIGLIAAAIWLLRKAF